MSQELTDVAGVGPSTARILADNNINSVRKLASTELSRLTEIPGIGEVIGKTMIKAAQSLLGPAETAAGSAVDSKGYSKKDKKKDKKKSKKDKKKKKGKDKKGNKKGK